MMLNVILKDICRAWRSIILFGILSAVSAVLLFFSATDFKNSAAEQRLVRMYSDQDISFLIPDTISSNASATDPSDHYYEADGNNGFASLLPLIEHMYSDSGNAGMVIELGDPEDRGYETVLVLGICNDLLVDGDIPGKGFTLLATPDLYKKRSGSIRIGKDKVEISGDIPAPALFAPSAGFTPAEEINNTLFICSRDLPAVLRSFQWIQLYDLSGMAFIDRMVIKDLSTEGNMELRKTVSTLIGSYVSVVSCKDYYGSIKLDEVKQQSFYILFFSLAYAVTPLASFLNCLLSITDNRRNYVIHRISGASLSCIFARILVLALSYFLFPALAVHIILGSTAYRTGRSMFLIAALPAAVFTAVAAYLRLLPILRTAEGGSVNE